MISIVCVYNDKEKLNNVFLQSLYKQVGVVYEVILVDSMKENYKSASQALNAGGKKAKGEYIFFIHQDVSFEKEDTLKELESYCRKTSFGIAGVAGIAPNENGKYITYTNIVHGTEKTKAGHALGDKVTEAVGLDECVLIIPQKIFEKYQFRNIGNTWHLYGTDYAIQMQEQNEKVWIFPVCIWHYSNGSSLNIDYFDAVKNLALLSKKYKYITTIYGKWPTNIMALEIKCRYRKLRFLLRGR